MARPDTRYVCGSCGTWHAKWSGRCDACGEWNTLAEEAAPKPVPKGLRAALAEHRQLTHRQKEELGARLQALGGEANGGRGMMQRLVGWVWESWRREPDDIDRAVQNLLKATEIEALLKKGIPCVGSDT